MAKLLNGRELAEFIKEQQAREVRSLKQSKGIIPRLVILRTNPNVVTNIYVRLKERYGDDIGVVVDVIDIEENEVIKTIESLNNDVLVHGIIVQLPLKDTKMSDMVLNNIAPQKDVDGLGVEASYDSATATAINWLLAGYNIELNGKKIVVVGKGRLVGNPLMELWSKSGLDVVSVDLDTKNRDEIIKNADILVTATGSPGTINSEIVKHGAVVIDAGQATQHNNVVGDVDQGVRSRDDITITPEKGGVGPLTIAALFNNVLVSSRRTTL